jgi:hypothetical protein
VVLGYATTELGTSIFELQRWPKQGGMTSAILSGCWLIVHSTGHIPRPACQDMLRDKHRCAGSLEEQKYCLDILPVFAFSRCNSQLYQSLWNINLTSPIFPAYWKVPRKFHPHLRKRQSRGDLTCQCLPAFRSLSPHHVRSFPRDECYFSQLTKILILKLGSRDVSLNVWRFQEENEVAMP